MHSSEGDAMALMTLAQAASQRYEHSQAQDDKSLAVLEAAARHVSAQSREREETEGEETELEVMSK